MNGTRRQDKEPHLLDVGEYRMYEGDLWFRDPAGQIGRVSPKVHTITEHKDGTITVSPSIACSGGGVSWHGFLERGVWRTV